MKMRIITPKTRSFLWLLLAALWMGGGLLACGPGLTPGAPVIRDLTFLGQTPADPRRFCFSIEWLDEEGDMTTATTGAEVRFSVQNLDDPNAPELNVTPFNIGNTFIQPGTNSGIIPGLCLDLREPTGVWPQRIKFFAQIVDSEERKSNKASVIVKVKLP